MSTAQEIVVDALGMLGVLDINETAPSSVEMSKHLRSLTQMIDAWAAEGLKVEDQTITGTVDGSTAVITDVSDTTKVAPGMTVTGTGVSGRILSVDDANDTITMNAVTTVAGSEVSLACTAMPFQSKFEQGVTALLALRLAPLYEAQPPDYVVKMAADGWQALQANFARPGVMGFDPALTNTSTGRPVLIGTE
jgi:hypothetical protein